MTRILVFGMTETPGGVESVIMNYYRNIDKEKIQFDFLCNTQVVAYEDEIKKLGGRIYKICSRSKNIKQYYKQLKDFFKKEAYKYKTIWVNVCSLANIDYLIYAKKYGIKYRIIHCHNSQNMDSNLRKVIHLLNKARLQKYATDYWTCSQKANTWFFSKKLIQQNKVLQINNAIDYNKFKYNEVIRKEYREKLEIDSKIAFGHIGRFHFQKNQVKLLEIFAKINEKNPNTELFLVGDGEDRELIVNKINELKLKESVKLLGIRNDIPNVMQAFDAIIFPSLFEGLPLVLVEAQANGLPIFTSDNITREIVMSDNIHFISLNESDEEWANIILSSNFDRANNYERIEKNGYDIKNESKKIERLLLRK